VASICPTLNIRGHPTTAGDGEAAARQDFDAAFLSSDKDALWDRFYNGSATTTERRVIPENGVEDREKLPHHGNEGDLIGSAAGSELVVEGPERGTAPGGSQSRDV
jgi:hypothetical protein